MHRLLAIETFVTFFDLCFFVSFLFRFISLLYLFLFLFLFYSFVFKLMVEMKLSAHLQLYDEQTEKLKKYKCENSNIRWSEEILDRYSYAYDTYDPQNVMGKCLISVNDHKNNNDKNTSIKHFVSNKMNLKKNRFFIISRTLVPNSAFTFFSVSKRRNERKEFYLVVCCARIIEHFILFFLFLFIVFCVERNNCWLDKNRNRWVVNSFFSLSQFYVLFLNLDVNERLRICDDDVLKLKLCSVRCAYVCIKPPKKTKNVSKYFSILSWTKFFDRAWQIV